MSDIIKLSKVSYTYPNAQEQTLKDINLEIKKGALTTICGVNGAGKTSLGLLLRGFIPKIYHGEYAGEYLLASKSIDQLNLSQLCSEIGYVFQNPFTQMSAAKDTVFEEIAFGLENLGVEREQIIKRVEETIDLLDLQAIAERNPMNLSGGQKQKVAIASIIVMNPEILILDEPTSQLDPQATAEIFAILKLLKDQGKTIILIEHKMELIAKYSDELILLEAGEVLTYGPINEVFGSPEFAKSKVALPVAYRLHQALEAKQVTLNAQNDAKLTKVMGGK